MKTNFARLVCKSLAVALALLLVACAKNEDQDITRSGIIYCSEGTPISFNPQLDTSGTTVDASSHQLYDRLLEFDPETSKIVPGIAESWRVSRDGKIYTFQLRKK